MIKEQDIIMSTRMSLSDISIGLNTMADLV